METEGKEKGAKVKATIGVYSVGNPRSEEYESGIWIYKEQLKIRPFAVSSGLKYKKR